MIPIRDQIDALSNTLLKTPGIEKAAGVTPQFLDTVRANIGEYITRTTGQILDANPKMSEEWIRPLGVCITLKRDLKL